MTTASVDWRRRRPGRRHHRDPHGRGPDRPDRRRADRRRAGPDHAGGGRAVGHPTGAARRSGPRCRTIGAEALATPSVIVVGEVAAVDLAWFERRPLFGRRVVVTRTRAQASALSRALREAGADPIEVPVIAISDPADGGAALQSAVRSLGSYDWVVVTSPNGAERVLGALREADLDARAFGAGAGRGHRSGHRRGARRRRRAGRPGPGALRGGVAPRGDGELGVAGAGAAGTGRGRA